LESLHTSALNLSIAPQHCNHKLCHTCSSSRLLQGTRVWWGSPHTSPPHTLQPLFCLLQGTDFVVGEYVDMTGVHGSRRQVEKPFVPPELLNAPPPPGLLAAMAPAPSKKRKSTCERCFVEGLGMG